MATTGRTAGLAVGMIVAALLVPAGAGAAVSAPTTTIDEYGGSAACSLREAVEAVNTQADVSGCLYTAGADVIVLESGFTYVLTTSGDDATNVNGDLDILRDVEITTSGDVPATIDAAFGDGPAAGDRIFDVGPTGVVEDFDVVNLVLTGGFTGSDDSVLDNWGGAIRVAADTEEVVIRDTRITDNEGTERGGAIYVGGGEVDIENSTIDHNRTTVTSAGNGNGGGIYLDGGDLTITNSTIAHNEAANDGGGIYDVGAESSLRMFNVTIAENTADADTGGPTAGDGGGLWSPVPPLVPPTRLPAAYNTLIADNRDLSGDAPSDCVASLLGTFVLVESGPSCGTEQGIPAGNIVGKDPLLGPLAVNAPGATPTMGLHWGSPALDAGHDPICPDTDQRGVDRLDRCDIGAFEGALPRSPVAYVPNLLLPPLAPRCKALKPACGCKRKKKVKKKGKKKAAFAKKKKQRCGKKKRKR
jgi:CSLREA domain-containing protein